MLEIEVAGVRGFCPVYRVGDKVVVDDPEKIVDCVKLVLGEKKDWENPFGDGEAGRRIVEVLKKKIFLCQETSPKNIIGRF